MDQNQEQPEKEETLATPGVLDKYQSAGKIANSVLERVIKKCVPDADIAEICAFGDSELLGELQKVYNKKKLEKGIAFPTCVSPNEICGYFSPLKSESIKLKQGDVAKIQLGCHIDGFIALVGHTIVVGEPEVKDRKADAILAAYKSVQAAFRLLKPGQHNQEVTKTIQQICTSYGCTPLEGVLSHEMKKHFIDGNRVIINREAPDQHVEDVEFQVNDLFALDVIVSTGEGKARDTEFRTTVYKRALDRAYQLKTKHGRAFMAEVIEKYPALCFSLRQFEDEITAKLAVQECSKHELLNGYPVLQSPNEIIAQFTLTVAVMSSSTIAITGINLDEAQFKTDKKIEDQNIAKLLETSMDKDAQKKQKKQKNQETA